MIIEGHKDRSIGHLLTADESLRATVFGSYPPVDVLFERVLTRVSREQSVEEALQRAPAELVSPPTLTRRERDVVSLRINLTTGKLTPFRVIGESLSISVATARRDFLNARFKIQTIKGTFTG